MNIRQQELRKRFRAETDLEVTKENFSDYTLWLERFISKEINEGLLLENSHLREVMQKVMDILDDGITKRVISEG